MEWRGRSGMQGEKKSRCEKDGKLIGGKKSGS
jgi:hypothetical protein